MRARMVKPEFFDDEKLSSISRDARILFIGLWVQSDDYAVVKGNHKWLRAKIFPYDDDVTPQKFSKWIQELETIDCIRPFQANGENFYWIRTFTKHQTINKPSQTRNPTPPDSLLEDYYTTPTLLPSETEVEVKEKRNTSEQISEANDKGFEAFWNAYPKRKNKMQAQNAWHQLKKKGKLPDITRILDAIQKELQSDDWMKESGQFIPYPASWLNAGGWDNEPLPATHNRKPCPHGIQPEDCPICRDHLKPIKSIFSIKGTQP